MRVVFFICIFVINVYGGGNIECDYKKFLTNLIYSENVWLPTKISDNMPVEKIETDKAGRVWIKTWKSDPFPVNMAINEVIENHSIEYALGISGIMFRVKYPLLEKYKDKPIRLRIYRNDCDLSNITLEIVLSVYPGEKKKETIVFSKFKL